ncbi:MAG: undecaprenyldiphospho-muramoylpentapeptide beta-N-acetylglucosaminyltransferase [Verrucomicrobia bacterium]|nr:undecaprenyldiphospho-muramoylpentapeptide beta-N-acetylglucosaminyltransferase [Verrucomicrobiota bacterium]
MSRANAKPFVAIACGGTGGHLFPGLAVAQALQARGCDLALLVSPKEVDQQGVKSATGMQIVTLPAVGLQGGAWLKFARGFWQSYRAAKKFFQARPPQAVLAMGGFTSAPPVLAAKSFGAATFLHESNTIPGRANRFLARFVDEAFVGFPSAAARLKLRRVTVTGTPVRPQFAPMDTAAARVKLGLDPHRPTLLVTGGSQGARGVNDLVLAALPRLAAAIPDLQILHLTGAEDAERTQQAYAKNNLRAVVRPFLAEMESALGAATVAVSRAGASSLAELAAMRVPAVLIPYPAAADNHQFHNAAAFAQTGAARMLEQASTTPETFSQTLVELFQKSETRSAMSAALARWHQPAAATQIAERMMQAMRVRTEISAVVGHREKVNPEHAEKDIRLHASAPANQTP